MLVLLEPRSAETPSPRPKTRSPSSALQIIATFMVVPLSGWNRSPQPGPMQGPGGGERPGGAARPSTPRLEHRRVHGVDRRVARHRGEPGGDGAAARGEPASAPLPRQRGATADVARDLSGDARVDARRSALAAPGDDPRA